MLDNERSLVTSHQVSLGGPLGFFRLVVFLPELTDVVFFYKPQCKWRERFTFETSRRKRR